jgi:hypothetical protein
MWQSESALHLSRFRKENPHKSENLAYEGLKDLDTREYCKTLRSFAVEIDSWSEVRELLLHDAQIILDTTPFKYILQLRNLERFKCTVEHPTSLYNGLPPYKVQKQVEDAVCAVVVKKEEWLRGELVGHDAENMRREIPVLFMVKTAKWSGTLSTSIFALWSSICLRLYGWG